MLTNARSLSPKIESLQNNFTEHELDFALITESWLKDSAILDRDVIDLEFGTNLKILYKNRPRKTASSRAVGGGVSIVYNKSRCSFKERKISGNKFELVAAVGKIGKVARQVAIFCVYVQPRMLAGDLQQLNDVINNEILLLKSRSDPLIFIGGDLNHRSLDDSISDFNDIRQINFDPTRGQACLDIVLSNARPITSDVGPPLETLAGVRSDHNCVLFKARETKTRPFIWVKKLVRIHSERAMIQFGNELLSSDWQKICPSDGDPDDLVQAFQSHITDLTDRYFPVKVSRRRSNEDPWITEGIRKLSKQKKRVFKRDGKTRLWMRLRDDLERRLCHSKMQIVDKASDSGSTRAYYSAVKTLSSAEKPVEWSVGDLFPDKSPEEAGNLTADYFTKITDLFEPLRPSPSTATPRADLTETEVLSFLKKAKKPSSSVQGDMLPRLMKVHYAKIVTPVTNIFNAVFRKQKWPKQWKEETTVVIPKCSAPTSLPSAET